MPLEPLFKKLDDAGFDTSPRVRLLAQTALYQSGQDYIAALAELKYLLTPLLAKSARQQEQCYAIFDAFLENCAAEAERLTEPSIEATPSPIPESTPEKASPLRWLWLLLLLPLAWGLWQWLKEKPMPPTVTFAKNRIGLLREGQTLQLENLSSGLKDTAFVWEISDAESGEVAFRDSSQHLDWVAKGYGSDKIIALRHASGLFDSARVHIHCADAPLLAENADFPRSPLQVGQAYAFAVKTDSAQVAVAWIIGGDTLIAQPVQGSPDLYQLSHAFEGAGETFVRCIAYRPDAPEDCYTLKEFPFSIGANQPILATAELRPDLPRRILQVADWVWLLLLLPVLAAAWLLWRWWKKRREKPQSVSKSGDQLAAEFPIHDQAPYYIPYRNRNNLIAVPPDFYRMADVLRRREESERFQFDPGASVQATIRGGGFPQLLEAAETMPGDYLFLVERPSERHQLGRLLERLSSFFQGQDAPVEAWFHDGNFRLFWRANAQEEISLQALQRRYPGHRLVLLGDGHQLFNPYAQDLPALQAPLQEVLLRWPKRLLLSPVAVADWTFYEKLLYRHFLLYPADTRGILEGLEALDALEEFEPGQYSRHEAEQARCRPVQSHRYASWDSLEAHRDYLGDDPEAFRWLCGLAVNAAPDWSLTLAIGRAMGIALSHDRLLALTRIPWLAANEDHTALRLALLGQLSREDERAARQAAAEELEALRDSLSGSFAELEWKSNLAVQHFALDPQDEAHKSLIRDLKAAGLLSSSQVQELDYLVQTRIARDGSLPGTAYDSLDAWLDTPPPRPFWTGQLIAAIGLATAAILLNWLIWNFNRQEIPLGSEAAPAFWQQAETLDDPALRWHNQAVAIAERLRTVEGYTAWQALQDSASLADSLFGLARAARAEGYGLADTNLTAFRYNMAAQAFNFVLADSLGQEQLPGIETRFALAAQPNVQGDIASHIVLDAVHGQGLCQYYLYQNTPGQSVHCDSAFALYSALLAATDSLYFAFLAEAMPVNLETLLRQLDCRPAVLPEPIVIPTPAPTYLLRIKVLDESSRRPIAGAELLLANLPPQQTDANGQAEWRLSAAQAGSVLDIQVQAEGYQPASGRIPPREGSEPYTLTLMPLPAPPRDRDGDGLPDGEDRCPEQAGPANLRGCPDQDADGIADPDDQCPTEPGTAQRQGCPEPLSKSEVPRPDMVRVQGGSFDMGDVMGDKEYEDETVHRVTLSDFYLGLTEVTFAEYDAFCEATGREKPKDQGWGRGQRPVIDVSWYDVVAYCNWLSEQHDYTPVYTIKGETVTANWSANGYRLPTEAEWEYAAREGGRKVRFGNGKDVADPKEINFNASTDYKKPYSVVGEYRVKTVPVGSLNSPNALGLHDMSGNVWEWCWDWYGSYPSGAQTNPKGAEQGSRRVIRGGGWDSNPQYCRAAYRSAWDPAYRDNAVGFRLARS